MCMSNTPLAAMNWHLSPSQARILSSYFTPRTPMEVLRPLSQPSVLLIAHRYAWVDFAVIVGHACPPALQHS